ncbi:MAG TPA: hypothetical protein VJN71_08280 [Nitrososphaerales archaeon]|nr:hypothetical protein [Nitrososphaerales archaeon]
MELKPTVLAGFLTALIVISVLVGIQIGNYFGTRPVPLSNRGGNLGFVPPFPEVLDGIVSWNSSIISQDQTINVNVSITNPSFWNTSVVVPYARCISGTMLSRTNGSQIDSLIGNCTYQNFNDTMKPGQSSMMSYIVGFRDNLPPIPYGASNGGCGGNLSELEYCWPVSQDLGSGQYELTVSIYNPGQRSVSIIIPINIIT